MQYRAVYNTGAVYSRAKQNNATINETIIKRRRRRRRNTVVVVVISTVSCVYKILSFLKDLTIIIKHTHTHTELVSWSVGWLAHG